MERATLLALKVTEKSAKKSTNYVSHWENASQRLQKNALLIKGPTLYYTISLISYFALLIGQTTWLLLFYSADDAPRSIALLLLIGPLLIPLHGLLNGRKYTYAWVTLFVWFYFVYGIWNVVSPDQRGLGIIQIVGSLGLFAGTMLYVRKT